MADYVILIIGDDDRWWRQATEEDRRATYAEYERFAAELPRRGHRILGGAELRPAWEARHLAANATGPTEGPYAETTEQVGGFYQVASDDLDDLLDVCRILSDIGTVIEVRRVVTDAERTA